MGRVWRVIFWVMAALVVLLLSLGIMALFYPADAYTLRDGRFVELLRPFTYTYALSGDLLGLGAASGSPKLPFHAAHWRSAIALCMVWGIVWGVRMLFVNTERAQTPFTAQNVKALRWVGGAMIGCFVLPQALSAILLLCAGQSDVVFINAGMPLLGIFLGVTLFSVAQIFQYGCRLQQESDETL